MLTISELKEMFRRYDFRPLKKLGENYLIDSNIKDKIISYASLKEADTVLEIGPGLGALTIDIAETGASVIGVEKDKKAFSILRRMVAEKKLTNLRLVCGDILKFDIGSINTPRKIKVIGNLPYYITTPIIEFLIKSRARIEFALITVQREVANRLLASPGSKEYSALTCFVQYYTRGEYLYTVKRTSFYPEPEVDSSLVRLDMLARPSVAVKDEDMLFRIIRSSFNQRRKSIINSLSREGALNLPKGDLAALLDRIKIDPAQRPETISLADFAKIANSISARC
ncbi:MAG: 16S rRNA (adenine(1518)-N(6)/adenine(1519)-N(6))-dimethyltransferase RsmA [Candidatus Omnitrophica bacterium]|nr:16S rRNA (adenine(1518)-N(6)/adenine(1519)-N(6))-dimethyltransferase RsmA [Candidatus Omnitrophota bacterium]